MHKKAQLPLTPSTLQTCSPSILLISHVWAILDCTGIGQVEADDDQLIHPAIGSPAAQHPLADGLATMDQQLSHILQTPAIRVSYV